MNQSQPKASHSRLRLAALATTALVLFYLAISLFHSNVMRQAGRERDEQMRFEIARAAEEHRRLWDTVHRNEGRIDRNEQHIHEMMTLMVPTTRRAEQ